MLRFNLKVKTPQVVNGNADLSPIRRTKLEAN